MPTQNAPHKVSRTCCYQPWWKWWCKVQLVQVVVEVVVVEMASGNVNDVVMLNHASKLNTL